MVRIVVVLHRTRGPLDSYPAAKGVVGDRRRNTGPLDTDRPPRRIAFDARQRPVRIDGLGDAPRRIAHDDLIARPITETDRPTQSIRNDPLNGLIIDGGRILAPRDLSDRADRVAPVGETTSRKRDSGSCTNPQVRPSGSVTEARFPKSSQVDVMTRPNGSVDDASKPDGPYSTLDLAP
ncbi:hypothetical protein [Actinomyces mediterranea]|uniref:hypothetical protein n=1 Tax=Actinomyces mediterranea TaxID=1871028 RepID=UPI001F283F88|nr:hypothetical protein [Actinomyces mediterranea]